HRSVALHQDRESRLVTTADVVRQQLPVGPSRPITQRPAQVLEDPVQLSGRHVLPFVGLDCPLSYYYPHRLGLIPVFSTGGADNTAQLGSRARRRQEKPVRPVSRPGRRADKELEPIPGARPLREQIIP